MKENTVFRERPIKKNQLGGVKKRKKHDGIKKSPELHSNLAGNAEHTEGLKDLWVEGRPGGNLRAENRRSRSHALEPPTLLNNQNK